MNWLCRIGLHKWRKVAEGFSPVAKFSSVFECAREGCDAKREDVIDVTNFY